LSVLLDEIFGKSNFINLISVRDSHPSGLKLSAKNKKIIKTKSSIILFKKAELKIYPI
jgi:adenine-specific DNA-methyltransferase